MARQSAADVPVGSCLSGGIDSGAISALAAASLPKLPTFTIGFDMSRVSGIEANFDERRQAQQIAALIKSRHFETVISSRDIETALPPLVRHPEDPRLGPRLGMSYPNYYDERSAIEQGLAQADRGEFASSARCAGNLRQVVRDCEPGRLALDEDVR